MPGYCDALLELIDRELYQMHQPDRRERIGLFILVALAAGGGIAVIVWFIKAVVMAAQWGVK